MQNIHFIGICGTAMGSVAAAMKAKGYHVTGSDEKVYPPISTFLEAQGITIITGYSAENIPDNTDTVVIGNAISRGNPEAEEVLNRKLHYLSLPEILKEQFLRGKHNLVVTGTHGKTTTSSLLAWMFTHAKHDPSHVIGGIPRNLGKGAKFTDSSYTILEGDEYDTAFFDKRSKFLHYLPEVAIINNIEFDHADIYNNLDEIKLTFSRLLRIVPRNGMAFLNGDDPNCLDISKEAPCPISFVGFSEKCQLRIANVDTSQAGTTFQLNKQSYNIPLKGEFNVRNAAMAISAARFSGVPNDEIQKSLHEFKGVARRQEVRATVEGITVIDDFAHHPTAIAQVIEGLKASYPGSRILTAFEPRSNTTRRKVFQKELASSLAKADLVCIPLVPELQKIPKNERLSSPQLASDLMDRGTQAFAFSNTAHIIKKLTSEALLGDVIAILSNGGFDGIHEKLIQSLQEKHQVKIKELTT